MQRINSFVFGGMFALVSCFAQTGYTRSPTIAQTQAQLAQLNTQIQQLKQSLSRTQDKRGVLMHELSTTEKQIGACLQKINLTEQAIKLKQGHISQLQKGLDVLTKELTQQESVLANQLKARYKMGGYQPIVIALNQNDLYKINQLLTLYQYILRERQHSIDAIIQTQKKIATEQDVLQGEIKAQLVLQEELHTQQQHFKESKSYQQVVIKSLNEEIHSQQHVLVEYEQNKINLSRLLLTLANQSVLFKRTVTVKEFTFMRHKLPLPVKVSQNAIERVSQGVTFLAQEGTPVYAVYPGRVVFSDWLRGYGLLLIVDHGQGYMTLYAHNQSLFKSKGALVTQGEKIAAIGHTGGLKENGLYFEVRQRGKALPPKEWLT